MKKRLYKINEYGIDNKNVVYLIGGWGVPQWMMFPVSKLLEAAGYYCITITLSRDVLSPDMGKSIQSILQVKHYILHSIERLADTGHLHFSLFGTSLGALVSLLVANTSPRIHKVIFNIPGMDLAESIWRWEGVLSGFRSEVAQQYSSYQELRRKISPINTTNHFSKLQGKDLLFFLSANDKIALSDSGQLKNTLESYNYQFEIVVNKYFGHVMTGFINLANAPQYLNFLSQKSQH